MVKGIAVLAVPASFTGDLTLSVGKDDSGGRGGFSVGLERFRPVQKPKRKGGDPGSIPGGSTSVEYTFAAGANS